MVVRTDTERTRHSRRLVLELLGSSVDLSLTANVDRWNAEYGAEPVRARSDRTRRQTVDQPVKVDNPLYVRDYAKCILCYQCVDACGEQWQQTWAIGVAGRGFDARISTEFDVELPESACVYCGNCIQVCPTGALMFTSEHDMRAEGTWDARAPDADRHDLPLLRCRLHVDAARPGRRDRQGLAHRRTTRSRPATSASRAASASSTSRTIRVLESIRVSGARRARTHTRMAPNTRMGSALGSSGRAAGGRTGPGLLGVLAAAGQTPSCAHTPAQST